MLPEFSKRTRVLIVGLLLSGLLHSISAAGELSLGDTDGGFFLAGGPGWSVVSNLSREKPWEEILYYLDATVAAGYRWNCWGLFGVLEYNSWTKMEGTRERFHSAFNLGLGGERLYFGDRARTSLAAGLAIKHWGEDLQEAGKLGFFLDVRPAGFRFKLSNSLALVLDPLSVILEAPVLEGIPLVVFQFRSILVMEWQP